MTENDIRNAIIEYLIFNGFLVLRINSGAVTKEYTDKRGRTRRRFYWLIKWFVLGDDPQVAGVFDVLAFRADMPPLAIDAKLPGEELRPAQVKFAEAWRARGGVAIAACSVDEVMAALGGAE